MKTQTIFRIFRGEVIALFPYEIEYKYDCLSYMHVGQHSAADYQHVIRHSKPAKPEQYRHLLIELSQIGYNVEVINRISAIRLRAARRIQYLRRAIYLENISYSEIYELQSLKRFIDKDDVYLMQWIKPA